jgi:co-chaperonin GroES (HSP10)
MENKIIPTADNILVKIVEKTQTESGLILPNRSKDVKKGGTVGDVEDYNRRVSFYVEAISPEIDEKLISFKVGDKVCFQEKPGIQLMVDAKSYGDREEFYMLAFAQDVRAVIQ